MKSQVSVNKSFVNFERFLNEVHTGTSSPALTYLPPEYCNKICDYYDSVKKNNGIIGKSWDFIKNKLNLKSSSKNTEIALNKLKNNRYDEENEKEAIVAVNKYAKSQLTAGIVTRNTSASMLAGVGLAIFKKATKNLKCDSKLLIGIGVGAALGAIGAVVIKAIDAKSANRKYSKKEIIYDGAQGMAQGLLSGIFSNEVIGGFNKGNNKIVNSLAKKVVILASKIASQVSIMMFEIEKKVLKKFNIDTDSIQSMQQIFSKQITEQYDEYEYFDPRAEKSA